MELIEMAKVKQGIIYEKNKGEEIVIGFQRGNEGRNHVTIANKSYDKFGDCSLEEILSHIVSRARGNNNWEFWMACPRNVAKTNAKAIDGMRAKIYREKLGSSDTNYTAFLDNVKKTIVEFQEKSGIGTFRFDNRNILSLAKDGRLELDATSPTRIHIESLVCEGLVEKVKEGGGEEEDKRKSYYQSCSLSRCPLLNQGKGDDLFCGCKEFVKKRKGDVLSKD